MDNCNYYVTCHIDASYNKNKWILDSTKDIAKSINFINLKIDSSHIVDDQSKQENGVERKYVRYEMSLFSPLSTKQTPRYT